MIGDLFGNIGEQQAQIQQQLEQIEISHSSSNGELSIQLTAAKTITDISIDYKKIDLSDSGHLEDLLTITMNQAFEMADESAKEVTQKIINEMLPPGFGNMFDS